MKSIKFYIASLLSELYYPLFKMKKYNIMSISETIDYLSIPGNSIVRFGDGEFLLMSNKGINFQEWDPQLSTMLRETINELHIDKLLICLPEPLRSLQNIKKKSKPVWKLNFFINRKMYSNNCSNKYRYGNSFVSRPYMAFKSKREADKVFKKILDLFCDKDILIIEGEYSRSGVGNDLFGKAKSLNRIICPSSNAFRNYNKILEAAKYYGKNRLILVALGPTAKPLILQLAQEGYWAIDIGHLDSEYEWYLNKTEEKTRNQNKHFAESDDTMIAPCTDEDYIKSVVCNIIE